MDSFATISSAETGQASALFNAQRQIGASLGVALLSSVISAVGMTQLSTSGAIIPNLTANHAHSSPLPHSRFSGHVLG
jgi:predicted MFS family arabinose efflux permease